MLAFQQLQIIFENGTFEEYKKAFEKYCEETGQSETEANKMLFDIPEQMANEILKHYMKK